MKKEYDNSNLAPLNLNVDTAMALKEAEEAFTSTTVKAKKTLIGNELDLKTWKQKKVKEIETKFIVPPFAFQRLGQNDEFGDLDTTENLDPIKVAAMNSAKYYFLIDGYRRFRFFEKKGITIIECEIIGIAECISQVSAARANVMSILTKPLTNLELSLGFYSLATELQDEFGSSYFYKHGGDRKKNNVKQASIVEYMAKLVGMKPWAVQALFKFGKELGPYALKGIQNLDEFKDLPIRSVQKINGYLAKDNLGAKIGERVTEMIDLAKDDEEINAKVGKIAFDHIQKKLAKKAKPNGRTTNEPDPNIDEGGKGISKVKFTVTDIKTPPRIENKKDKGPPDRDHNDSNRANKDSVQDEGLKKERPHKDEVAVSISNAKDHINNLISQLKSLKEYMRSDSKIIPIKKHNIMSKRKEAQRAWRDLEICMDLILS